MNGTNTLLNVLKCCLTVTLFTLVFSNSICGQFQIDVEGDAKIRGRIDLLSDGINNVFIGQDAGIVCSGENNVLLGVRAGFRLLSGGANTYIGHEAGRNIFSGNQNTSLGYFSMSNNQNTSKNIAIGPRALLRLEDGYGLDPVAGNADLGTTYNLAIGTNAGQFTNDTSGSGAERNTFIGNNSGTQNTTGFRNTFLGFQSGDQNTTGRWNTCIGHQADLSTGNLSNAGAFGADAIVNASNKIRIGDGLVTTVEGQGWSLPSDGRFKKNIQENVPGLDFLMALRPVTYQYDMEKYYNHILPQADRIGESKGGKVKLSSNEIEKVSERIQTGFVAQEVESAAQNMGYDFNGVIVPKNSRDNYGISLQFVRCTDYQGNSRATKAVGSYSNGESDPPAAKRSVTSEIGAN